MPSRRKAFGGYSICFKGCKEPIQKIFGSKRLGPSQMTKRLWNYVKRKRLAKNH